jgi:competence protein ComEC
MRKNYLLLFLVLLLGNILVLRTLLAPATLEVSVFDVGKGNAILVRSPDKKTLLIDVGSDASILRAIGAALPFWQRRIDALILTSDKAAQIGGLSDVTDRYRTPVPLTIGTAETPYGSRLSFGSIRLTIISAGVLTISYGDTSLSVSSTTPEGVYISDGETLTKTTP